MLAEGKGLRVALTTLDTGRLTLPAACVGAVEALSENFARVGDRRMQWGAPIGKHAAIADKIARMAADIFAMESMTLLAASRVDRDKHADVRLEAAMCKLGRRRPRGASSMTRCRFAADAATKPPRR